MSSNLPLTKIAVFYDGNYFYHVSNYYNYVHERKCRISIKGLHNFIRHKVAELEGQALELRLCQIVDAHYFRGRLSASEASNKVNQLYYERVFEDILMSEGVTTHYLPLRTFSGRKTEKGVDVWLALEAFELAFYKRFDVVVLIASDGDYVPLIRKLNSLGIRVMVLAWDFEFIDDFGNNRATRTSQDLLEEAVYPLAMHELIDSRTAQDSFLADSLFVPRSAREPGNDSGSGHNPPATAGKKENGVKTSTILSLKEGYGFIQYPPNNLFFHYSELENADFNDLLIGDRVTFRVGKNEETGQDIATEINLLE
ncbi:MAG: NYN domain-containing protein [Lewinellaceae bacterium]|nr:NYN domain-containing protein [Lewinellaceae bacterium]